MDNDNGKRARASRSSFYEGEFTLDEMVFRPFNVATEMHIESLGLMPGPDDEPSENDDDAWLRIVINIAWTLWAPLEEVNDLCFAIEEAATDEEREEFRKQFRRKVLSFKSRISFENLPVIAQRITTVLMNQQALSFDLQKRASDSDSSEEESPPGNE